MADNTNTTATQTAIPAVQDATPASAFPTYTEAPLDTAGAGLGGMMIGADAGYGLDGGGRDNALITNAFGRAGEQKFLRDIQASNALMASQQLHRIDDQNYSKAYTTSLLNHINTNMAAARASGVAPEQALRNAFTAYTQNTRKHLTPDADGMIMSNLQTTANALANKMVQEGNIDGANSLLKDMGVNGGGIDPLRASVLSGNLPQFRNIVATNYGNAGLTYNPQNHTYKYLGTDIPEAMVLRAATDQNTPFMSGLNSYVAAQNLTGGLGGQPQTQQQQPIAVAPAIQALTVGAVPGSPEYIKNLKTLEQFNIDRQKAGVFRTLDANKKRILDSSFFNMSEGNTTQSRLVYDDGVSRLSTKNPLMILNTAYALSEGDLGKTRDYVTTTIAQLQGAANNIESKIEGLPNTPENSQKRESLKAQLKTYQRQVTGLSNGWSNLQASTQLQTPVQGYNNDSNAEALAREKTKYEGSLAPSTVMPTSPYPMVPVFTYSKEQAPTIEEKNRILADANSMTGALSDIKTLWSPKNYEDNTNGVVDIMNKKLIPMLINTRLRVSDIDAMVRQSGLTVGQAMMFNNQLSQLLNAQAGKEPNLDKKMSIYKLAQDISASSNNYMR